MKKTATIILAMLCFILITKAQEVKVNDNMIVEADGTVRYENSATIFDDLMVSPDATTKQGSNPPTLAKFKDNGSGSQGVFLWMFDFSIEQEVYFTVQLPHSYKVGSNIYPHVHWTTPTGTPTGTDVVWGLEYSVIAIGGTFSANTTIITANTVIPSIGTPVGTYQHLITEFAAINGTGFGVSTILVCRLFRKTADASDTFINPVGLLGFDIHFEKDTDGSRSEWTK